MQANKHGYVQSTRVILYRPEHIGHEVHLTRRRRGFSHEWLAQQCHCDARTIIRLEQGQTQHVDLEFIADIARVLHAPRLLRLGIAETIASLPRPVEGARAGRRPLARVIRFRSPDEAA